MNKNSVFYDIKCEMELDQDINYTNGRIEMIDDNRFEFITKDNVFKFKIVDKNYAKMIMNMFNQNFYAISKITMHQKNNKNFYLYIAFFCNMQNWGEIFIILNDKIKKTISKKYKNKKLTLEEILKENFTITDGNSSYFAYTKSQAYLESEIENEDLNNDINCHIGEYENKRSILTIYGKNFNINVRCMHKDSKYKAYVERIEFRRNNIPFMRIAKGKLDFFNKRENISKKLKEAMEDTNGYLNLWNKYSEEEGNLLLDKARKVGQIKIDRKKITYDEEGIHVPYSGLSKEAERIIGKDTFLLFSKEPPIYLKYENIDWKEYSNITHNKNKYKDKEIYFNRIENKHVRVISKKNGGFVLDLKDKKLPSEDFISLSIIGDESQIYRREVARNRIINGESANPALGLILEGKLTEEFCTYEKRKKIDPLSSFVKDKIFEYSPTETQKKAIEIALNTPDIAIIQGPPGTGKSTVITAIVERLNELCDKNTNLNGQVLITSFQHDAVRNVIERLKVNSLPTIKFGKQEREGEEDLTEEKRIKEWCEEYNQRLSEKNPEILEIEEKEKLINLYNIYLAYPNYNNAIKFLECAKNLNTDSTVDKKINIMLEDENIEERKIDTQLLNLIRRIRTTKEGFLDDGSENADNLLWTLENIGINKNIPENKKVIDILDKAAMCVNEPEDQLLENLKEVKNYLLKNCIPKSVYQSNIIDEKIIEIYTEVSQGIKEYKDEKTSILAELLRELNINRSGVEDTLKKYLFAYSSTTQQSEGKEIRIAKGLNKEEHPEYETVIVDEAARVNPIDLMIPLSQAKRKIILVGDHRQLPHMYDEEVFENIKNNGEDFKFSTIKKSMFEYLLEKARDLEKIDKIQRTIVLDAQYRMHPVLGNFVNDIFYKPNDESFRSPMPANKYEQKISKKQFPVEWYHIPDEYGAEKRIGTSRIRDCETDFIVEKIIKCINSKNGKNLSYGIIAFYREQVKNIKVKLKMKLGKEAEKIRVGSVDAFQGMEFDVIFLSVVRSNPNIPKVIEKKGEKPKNIDFNKLDMDVSKMDKDSEVYKKWENYKYKVGIQNYGFLISENRLCVSLTRQKKLLIVVGNSDIFSLGKWGRVADICVPGMKRLYELCKREGVIYDGHKGI
ncbi:AAA domain-containing protein [Peptacetobacter sp.]|nr:AAA domain-containing protein [Peptacetobacter sp.]